MFLFFSFFPLTQLIPELPVLVGHGGALLSPQRQPRVRHELLCDQRQHPRSVGVTHLQHLPHLEEHTKTHTAFYLMKNIFAIFFVSQERQ